MHDTDPIAFGVRLGDWLLALHRECLEPEPADFCRWALERLARVVPFDSASWGHGGAAPIVIHEAYLHKQPQEKAEAYARVKHDDYLFPEVVRRPGVTIDMYDLVPRADHVRRPIYRHYARRFGGEHVLCTSQRHADSGLSHFLNLWRADLGSPFSTADRAFKQLAMPHLVEARRRNLFEHVRLNARGGPGGCQAAICDPLGTLHDAEHGFAGVLAAQWPGWSGPRLPDALRTRMRRHDTGALKIGAIGADWSPVGSMMLVRVWTLGGADRLSPREREVADLLAAGHSHKAIARILGVEPTTVRSQTTTLYRKLGVSNRARMVGAWLAAGRGASADRAALSSSPTRPRP
jgi:DNA-binding CsgD family transcriptional regulator